jgi:hypothetical protein
MRSSLLYKKYMNIKISTDVILRVVLYLCDNWSPTMEEERAEGIQDLYAEGHVR